MRSSKGQRSPLTADESCSRTVVVKGALSDRCNRGGGLNCQEKDHWHLAARKQRNQKRSDFFHKRGIASPISITRNHQVLQEQRNAVIDGRSAGGYIDFATAGLAGHQLAV